MELGVWLGQIFWWNVAMAGRPSQVKLEQLHEWLRELKLDAPSLPNPKGAHAFRAASGNLTRRYTDDAGHDATLSTLEVTTSTDFIVRHVMKTAVDPRTQHSSAEKVAQLKFYRPTRTATGRRPGSEVSKPSLRPDLTGTDAEQVMAFIEDFRDAYAVRNEYLSMAALRRVVRDYVVLRCDGVCIRPSGGLYFVENRWSEEVKRLSILIDRFGPDSTSHVIPLIDEPSQRLLVAAGTADTLVAEARAILELSEPERATHRRTYLARQHLQRVIRLRRHFAPLMATDATALPRVDEAIVEAREFLEAAWEDTGGDKRRTKNNDLPESRPPRVRERPVPSGS